MKNYFKKLFGMQVDEEASNSEISDLPILKMKILKIHDQLNQKQPQEEYSLLNILENY
jgi:hypothetical protein